MDRKMANVHEEKPKYFKSSKLIFQYFISRCSTPKTEENDLIPGKKFFRLFEYNLRLYIGHLQNPISGDNWANLDQLRIFNVIKSSKSLDYGKHTRIS